MQRVRPRLVDANNGLLLAGTPTFAICTVTPIASPTMTEGYILYAPTGYLIRGYLPYFKAYTTFLHNRQRYK